MDKNYEYYFGGEVFDDSVFDCGPFVLYNKDIVDDGYGKGKEDMSCERDGKEYYGV